MGYGAIGIVSAETIDLKKLIWNAETKHSAVYSYHNSSLYHIGDCTKLQSFRHLNNDKIRLTIDIPDKSLTFWSMKTNKQLGKYEDINYSTTYKLAISLTGD